MLGLEAMERILKESKRFVLGVCACGCSITIPVRTREGLIRRFGYQHNMRFLHGYGQESSRWKNGTTRLKKGYIIDSKKNYIHRLVWEEHHRASLLKWADVHHKNGIKDDNVWYNLQAMMKSKHSRDYSGMKKNMKDRFCFVCSGKTGKDRRGREDWRRHPITKQEWLCKKCCKKIKRKLGISV